MTDTIFNHIDLPEKEVGIHKKILKSYLLEKYQKEKENQNLFMRGGDYMRRHMNFSPTRIAITVAIMLLAGASIGLGVKSIFSPIEANAKEIVEEAFDKFIKLTPQQQAELERIVQADLASSLEEAQDASDLEIVPEEELIRVEKENVPGVPTKGDAIYGSPAFTAYEPGGPIDPSQQKVTAGTKVFFGEGKIEVMRGVQVVRFTDKSGQKTILGINEKYEPVLKMVVMDKSKIKMMNTQGKPVSAPVFEWSKKEE